ncbi:4Fe-4S dicluster domain-containing protein, partial [Desulfonatronovibrio hydrogenovorans]|uniref:4Fe-4S dicluster domain-containing protein n=1 Tax=Desulfonatronovibrio hydrogenovorans TaxID=53245 RepID=UPI000491F8D0
MDGKGFFIDLTKCTACRGCQVACKQWHKLPAEETRNWGSHQNPKDLSFITYKVVRMNEIVEDNKLKNWVFFPDQCRHCLSPPCKMVGDMDDEQAILEDWNTGAILFTQRTQNLFFDEIRNSCPYDIPRENEKSLIMSKCDMCNDRVTNG